jgi:hypothetical protein
MFNRPPTHGNPDSPHSPKKIMLLLYTSRFHSSRISERTATHHTQIVMTLRGEPYRFSKKAAVLATQPSGMAFFFVCT